MVSVKEVLGNNMGKFYCVECKKIFDASDTRARFKPIFRWNRFSLHCYSFWEYHCIKCLEKSKNNQGFIQVPILIVVIAGILVLGSAGYFGIKQYQNYQIRRTEELYAKQQEQSKAEQQARDLEIENLKKELDTLKNQKPQVIIGDNPQIKTYDLPAIIREWRPRSAYIVCSWKDDLGQAYQAASGSGFLTILNSENQIITNKHVVVDSQYGVASVCIFKFPDDNGVYYLSNNKSILVDSTGYDVGYITNLESPHGTISKTIDERSKSSFNLCKQKPNIGDPVVVIGYPDYGSGSLVQNLKSVEVTATEGIISGFVNGYYTTSAKIEHGNSGGLAIDAISDCYLGIPSEAVVGGIESLGRILPASIFLHN